MASPDVQIQRVYSQYWDEVRQRAKPSKKVLIVEGDDDRLVIEKLLEQHSASWAGKVVVAAAFGRPKVLAKLESKPDWYGLVDRDTWDDGEVQAKQTSLPNLVITEGWCLENHFLSAAVLESVLGLTAGDLRDLDGQHAEWISYGAIRQTLKRVRDAFSSSLPAETYGRPDRIAAEPHERPAISARLTSLGYVQADSARDLANLLAQIEQQQQVLRSLPSDRAALGGIHGKEFFRIEVVPRLNRLRRQADEATWRTHIATRLGAHWPAYLVSLAGRLLA